MGDLCFWVTFKELFLLLFQNILLRGGILTWWNAWVEFIILDYQVLARLIREFWLLWLFPWDGWLLGRTLSAIVMLLLLLQHDLVLQVWVLDFKTFLFMFRWWTIVFRHFEIIKIGYRKHKHFEGKEILLFCNLKIE